MINKKCRDCGIKISKFAVRCKPCASIGKNNPMFGKINKWGNHSKEYKKKMADSRMGFKNPFYGKQHSEETKKKISKATKGENNPMFGKLGKESTNWKGGRNFSYGYILIYKQDYPFTVNNYVFEHRLVMEKHLGRYLTKEEVVHHIDFNRENNNINNLHLFPNHSEHINYHYFLRKCVKEALTL